jgi:hypothetical protein
MFILGRDRAILRKREIIDLAAAAFSIAVSPQAMFISLACTGTSSCARTRDVLRVCRVVCGAASIAMTSGVYLDRPGRSQELEEQFDDVLEHLGLLVPLRLGELQHDGLEANEGVVDDGLGLERRLALLRLRHLGLHVLVVG